MRRVVITGVGLVTPIGVGKEVFWSNLLAGKHGFSSVTSFNTDQYRVKVGAEIHDFRFEDHVPDADPKAYGPSTKFAVAAARMAMVDAGLTKGMVPPRRCGVSMGTTSGEPNLIEHFNDRIMAGEKDRIGDALVSLYPCHRIAQAIADDFGFTGMMPIMIPAACAAGNYAVAHAYDRIASGRSDLMLAGGSDAFSRITYTGFSRLMAISPDLCRPFDKNRKGMIPGEGAGILVLEPLETAVKRGARIYAEVAGYGMSCDAFHMTGSHPDSRGAKSAMTRALKQARINVDDVDYISAHGTGTKSNDMHETKSVKAVFGDAAYKVPISSIKSMLGHTMGAASAIEAAMCAMAIQESKIPPTMHLEDVDPQCDLDFVPGEARDLNLNVVMSNAYAFGGTNASLILKKLSEAGS